ncbi:MAG: hypothetical protein R2864_13475 [Syntrophotaleaceae bacterium]
MKQAYKLIFRSGLRVEETLDQIEAELAGCPEVAQLQYSFATAAVASPVDQG